MTRTRCDDIEFHICCRSRMIMKLILFIVNVSLITLKAEPSLESQSFVIPALRTKRETRSSYYSQSYGGQSNASIEALDIQTVVSNRFATTHIRSRVKNYNDISREVLFTAVISKNAYISGFFLSIGGRTYEAVVKEKEEAIQLYGAAVASGETSAHVGVSARNAQVIKVSVNVEAYEEVHFHLKYEELLQRRNNKYEIIINVQPESFVQEIDVRVDINETVPIKFVGAQNLGDFIYPQPILKPANDARQIGFQYHIPIFEQIIMARQKGVLAIEIVVAYDVERNSTGEPVLVSNDYFVQFFAPTMLQSLPKQVIFVLDTSGSMEGQKLSKVKEAMKIILQKLKPHDIFNIVQFSDKISIWNVPSESKITFSGDKYVESLKEWHIPREVTATSENIRHAQNIVDMFRTFGLTDIVAALETGIFLARKANEDGKDVYESIIIFLTDGQANAGLTDNPEEIINKVNELNTGNKKAAIFTLSFGEDADKRFLEKLALKNYASHRHIYDSADADMQLIDFFHEISSPLLKEVVFEYGDESVEEVTRNEFPTYYSGSELVVAGRRTNSSDISPKVKARTIEDTYEYHPGTQIIDTDLERLFIFLDIKQKIDELKTIRNKKTLRQEILEKSLRYSYVTPFTSLVVQKPNDVHNIAWIGDAFKRDNARKNFASVGTNGMERPQMMCCDNISPETTIDSLKKDLPWLSNILNSDGTLTIEEGWYKLGIGEKVDWQMICFNSINKSMGSCQLIQDCYPQIKDMVNSAADFEKHFCPLDKYAGVCCPTTNFKRPIEYGTIV